MTSTRAFSCQRESVPAARRFVRDALRDQPSEVVDSAELMASELVTNCIRHAQTDFEVTVSSSGQIRVEVSDSGGGRPQLQNPSPEAPSGRGLRIVEGMSQDWGVIGSARGKTVWFTLPTHAHAHGGSAEPARAEDPVDCTQPAHRVSESPGTRRHARTRPPRARRALA